MGNGLYVTLFVHKVPLPPPPPLDEINLTSHPLRSFVGDVLNKSKSGRSLFLPSWP